MVQTIGNPISWGIRQLGAAGGDVAGVTRRMGGTGDLPKVRALTAADLRMALRLGLRDFGALRTDVIAAALQMVGERLCIELPCPVNLKLHKGAPAIVNQSIVDIILGQTKLGKLVLRQVKTAVLPIFTHISQNIRQLQRHSQLNRIRNRRFTAVPNNVHGHQSNSGGNTVAIMCQIIKGGEPILDQVRGNAIQKLLCILAWNVVLCPCVCPRQRYRIVFARMISQTFLPPTQQFVQSVFFTLINNIITHTTKGVQRSYRCPLRSGQQGRSDIKSVAVFLSDGGTLLISIYEQFLIQG